MAHQHLVDEQRSNRPSRQTEPAPQQKEQPLTAAQIRAPMTTDTVRRMQQTLGNSAVQRMLVQRSGNEPAELDDETAGAINSRRGYGGALDEGMAAKAGGAMGHDFSDVNVHTDTTADTLARSVGARAFTTGNDIFFREGEYQPQSQHGQSLLAHELTHVVQQGAAAPSVQGKMTVNDPDDAFEAEADQVADAVMNQPAPVQQQEMPEEEEMQMQEMPEEEEEVMAMRQEMEEEEEAMA